MSVAVVMFRLPSDSELSAVTEMPTSWRRSSRRLAVTKISSRARSPVAAGCWASASTGAAASAAQVNRNRTRGSSLASRFDMCSPPNVLPRIFRLSAGCSRTFWSSASSWKTVRWFKRSVRHSRGHGTSPRELADRQRPDHLVRPAHPTDAVGIGQQHRMAGLLQPCDQLAQGRTRICDHETLARGAVWPTQVQRPAVELRRDGAILFVAQQLVLTRRVEPAATVAQLQIPPRTHDHAAVQHRQRVHVSHELGDVRIRRTQHDVRGRAALHDAASLEDRDPVAEPQGLVEVVGYEQDRLAHALLQRAQLVLQLAADQRIERRERLVHQQDLRVSRECARETDALLHAAGELVAVMIGPLRQSNELELLVDDATALGSRLAAQLEAQADVLANGAPRQQAELLKDHRDAAAPEPAQRRGVAVRDVNRLLGVGHEHAATRHGIQAVGGTQQRRFAGAGESHEHEDLALLDAQARAGHADDDTGGGLDLRTAAALVQRRKGSLDRRLALAALEPCEQDVDVLECQRGGHFAACDSAGRLMRSRMIATRTIAIPASKPIPTCTVLRARTTGTPRPPAPTSAAITTIDRLSMMHCVIPARIIGAALGSSTFSSSCKGVAPNAWPASSKGFGTDEMPTCVRRIGAGNAKITVEIKPGTTPSPNSTSVGVR